MLLSANAGDLLFIYAAFIQEVHNLNKIGGSLRLPCPVWHNWHTIYTTKALSKRCLFWVVLFRV
jgi:hypothetical protein